VSTQRAHEHAALNHRLTVIGGVLEDDCRAVLQEFFQARRTGVNAERLEAELNAAPSCLLGGPSRVTAIVSAA
jgi:hypothetical protein